MPIRALETVELIKKKNTPNLCHNGQHVSRFLSSVEYPRKRLGFSSVENTQQFYFGQNLFQSALSRPQQTEKEWKRANYHCGSSKSCKTEIQMHHH